MKKSLLPSLLTLAMILTSCGDQSTSTPTPQLAPLSPLVIHATTKVAGKTVLELRNTGTAALNYQVSSNADWLTVSTGAKGTVEPQTTKAVDLTGVCLSNSDLSGTVTVTVQGGDTTSVPVQLTCGELTLVTSAPPPIVLKTNLNSPVTTAFALKNTGQTPLTYTLTGMTSWLKVVSGQQGTLAAGSTSEVQLQATCGAEAGTLTGELRALDSYGRALVIPVSLVCTSTTPLLTVSRDTIDLSINRGESAETSFTLSNPNSFPVSYEGTWDNTVTGAEATVTGALSGTLKAGQSTDITVKVTCNASYVSGGSVFLNFKVPGQPTLYMRIAVLCVTPLQTPTPFTFTPLSGKDVLIGGAPVTSNTVTLSGITLPQTVTVEGGTLVINGTVLQWQPSATVKPGDTLAVQALTPLTPNATTSARVTVGSYSTTFNLTTPDGWLLAPPQDVPNGPQSLRQVDVNGDGRLDLIVSQMANLISFLAVKLLNADGSYTTVLNEAKPLYRYYLHDVQDVNGDGKPDLIESEDGTNRWVRLGNGDGTFAAPSPLPAGVTLPVSLDGVRRDLNRDGITDLIKLDSGVLQIYLGDSSGSLILNAQYATPNYRTRYSVAESLSVLDYNNDGKLDAYVFGYSPYYSRTQAAVYLGK